MGVTNHLLNGMILQEETLPEIHESTARTTFQRHVCTKKRHFTEDFRMWIFVEDIQRS